MGVGPTLKIENLRERRAAAKLTLQQLAELAGVSIGTISNGQMGKPLTKRAGEAILAVLEGKAPPPQTTTNGSKQAYAIAQLAQPEAEDPVVTAFKLLLEELDKRIDSKLKAAKPHSEQIAPLPQKLITLVPVPSPAEPERILTQEGAVAHGFPVTAAINNWSIRYERKFLKEFETSGLNGPVRAALQKFAQLGEQYSGLGFKKLNLATTRLKRDKWSRAAYAFRVNQRWRVLVRRDHGDKAYTITRLAHHDEIE